MDTSENKSSGLIPANLRPKAADPLDELTPKQRLFLMLLVEGVAPQDAYVKAGYDGDPKHASYQLKSRLDKQLTLMAVAHGMAKSDLILGMKKLNELPVVDKEGLPQSGISMQHKLRLMEMQLRVLDSIAERAPSEIMGIQINFGAENEDKPSPSSVVEAQVVPQGGGSDGAI